MLHMDEYSLYSMIYLWTETMYILNIGSLLRLKTIRFGIEKKSSKKGSSLTHAYRLAVKTLFIGPRLVWLQSSFHVDSMLAQCRTSPRFSVHYFHVFKFHIVLLVHAMYILYVLPKMSCIHLRCNIYHILFCSVNIPMVNTLSNTC